MKETYIYKITDELGNTRYIGKSNNPRRRLYQHIKDKSNLHKFNWLNSIIKRGHKPIIEIIEKVSIDSWKEREIYWISKFKEDGIDLINMTIGGDGAEGMIHTEESKKKMSNSKKGQKLSEEHKLKISEAVKLKAEENPFYNRSGNNLKQPLDRDLLYQLYITENLSTTIIAKQLDCSEKKVWDNLQDYGIKKDKRIWKKQCASNPTKIVLQYDLDGNLIKEWPSAVSVYKKLKIKPEKCCRGVQKTTGGFIWRYKDEWFDLGLDKLDEQSRQVSQYGLSGNWVKDFKSIKEASELNNINDDGIGSCCLGKSKSAGGYIWRYKGDEPPKKYTNKTIRAVLQYDLLGNLIDEYDSLVEAAKKTGSNSNGIQMCCVGKYKHSNNFIWKYK
jgi:group I intron endonuclease